jgi:transcription initiation factor IIF auxiliary subunit
MPSVQVKTVVSQAFLYDTGAFPSASLTQKPSKMSMPTCSPMSPTTSTSPSATRPSNVSRNTAHTHPAIPNTFFSAIKKPPFRVAEDGWGEFEMAIHMTDASGKTHQVVHDLNFQQAKYEVKHVIAFKNVKPGTAMAEKLRLSGSAPGDTTDGAPNSKKRASEVGTGAEKKKKKGGDNKSVNMDSLAEGLQKLGEDDLLQVVQMVHDNKSEESWLRNDVEQGEFHVDLYTLPENLINMLWAFTKDKGVLSADAAS